jgi:5-methylcytosine-specific restriction endonuclease McrA
MTEARIPTKIRTLVAKRAKRCCEYCRSQEQYSPDSFSIEHIQPLIKGGTSEANNLAYACQGCNNRKYIHVEEVDPVTQEVTSLYHPRKQNWVEHFAWSEDIAGSQRYASGQAVCDADL